MYIHSTLIIIVVLLVINYIHIIWLKDFFSESEPKLVALDFEYSGQGRVATEKNCYLQQMANFQNFGTDQI